MRTATSNMKEWKRRHAAARADRPGRPTTQDALDKVIGSADKKPTRASASTGSTPISRRRSRHEQAEFQRAAGDGRGALTGLPAGAAVLAVLGAAGALLGVGRRLSEYR